MFFTSRYLSDNVWHRCVGWKMSETHFPFLVSVQYLKPPPSIQSPCLVLLMLYFSRLFDSPRLAPPQGQRDSVSAIAQPFPSRQRWRRRGSSSRWVWRGPELFRKCGYSPAHPSHGCQSRQHHQQHPSQLRTLGDRGEAGL